jgi:hypothetical protein
MRSATSGEEMVQPQRRLARPYDFVRLLVVMNVSPSVAAGGVCESAASR